MMPSVYALFRSRLYFDEIYNAYVSKVQQRIADLMGFLDQIFISGLMVRGAAAVVGLIGMLARLTHVGSVHGYVYWFLAGVLIFWAFATGLI